MQVEECFSKVAPISAMFVSEIEQAVELVSDGDSEEYSELVAKTIGEGLAQPVFLLLRFAAISSGVDG